MRPRRHRLTYTIPYFVIDVGELETLHRDISIFSYREANLFSFSDNDHGAGFKRDGETLSQWITRELTGAGISDPIGRIEVVCLPRIMGYVFNPISIYFAYASDDRTIGVVYEVNNTFGEKQIYPFAVDECQNTRISHACEKTLYVSPFNDVIGSYDFAVTPPRTKFELGINYRDENGLILHAAMSGMTRPISKHSLIAIAARFPLAAFTIIAAIHWEALKLWLKGVPFRSRRQPKTASSPS